MKPSTHMHDIMKDRKSPNPHLCSHCHKIFKHTLQK